MIYNMYNLLLIHLKTLILVVIGVLSAFLAKGFLGNRTKGQQSVLKFVESTVIVHLVRHDICIVTETGGMMWAVVCYFTHLCKSNHKKARDLCHDAQILSQYFFHK